MSLENLEPKKQWESLKLTLIDIVNKVYEKEPDLRDRRVRAISEEDVASLKYLARVLLAKLDYDRKF